MDYYMCYHCILYLRAFFFFPEKISKKECATRLVCRGIKLNIHNKSVSVKVSVLTHSNSQENLLNSTSAYSDLHCTQFML